MAAFLGAAKRLGSVGRADKVPVALAAGWDDACLRADDQLREAVRRLMPGGADVILDPTGTASLERDLELLAPGGRVVLFGNAGGGAPARCPR